ncbi:MAG: aminotransferase class I/II-fold pyridoxal phosphate-dependent enzyme [bacterium]|jgi:O-succinylhomoserine sulfhydrylase
MKEKFETLAIRAQAERSQHKEHTVPLYLTSSYVFEDVEQGAALFAGGQEGYMYSRVANPNTDEFANKLALLEGGEAGIATATGMAAVFSTFGALLKSGDHLVSSTSIFGSTRHVIEQILPGWDIGFSFVSLKDKAGWRQAFKGNTKLVYVETPANPTLDLVDIEWLAGLCHDHGALLVVDNCFATPYLQQPLQSGADIVLHSATKFLDGQGRVMGGAIVGSSEVIEKCSAFIRKTGPSLSPFNAWILSKSLETLAVRMERHCENAMQLAGFLAERKEVASVVYPFLPGFEQYELARKQMKMGGGLVTCDLAGGLEAGKKFMNALKLHSLTANLGDTRSIATHPASTTHSKLTPEQQLQIGITPGLVRFSVGLENIDDILADVEQALDTL